MCETGASSDLPRITTNGRSNFGVSVSQSLPAPYVCIPWGPTLGALQIYALTGTYKRVLEAPRCTSQQDGQQDEMAA